MNDKANERMEQKNEAYSEHQRGLDNIKNTPMPEGQKFPPGTRVYITKNMPDFMSHFKHGCWGTVISTYNHAYGCGSKTEYSIDVGGHGISSWYYEYQLSLEEDNSDK